MKDDPEKVAHHCDHPTFHADLTARHTWLREWGGLHRKRVLDDPEYFDARAAGWWVWGISLWIGGGWCQVSYDRRPMVQATGGGRGVSAIGQMPHIHGNPTGGAGVRSRERRDALVGHMTDVVGGREARVHRASPGPDRWKERSRTYRGIADAMADQWGGG
ncbi:MAG: hypothetical protein OXD36_04670 [Rhodobacter sp.]|nr:hypothetical protein [Rhodobacter sp.]